MSNILKTSDVFGISNTILEKSYVDRSGLDENLKILLGRRTHIALRGESKCGKSWLRQRVVPNAVVVQCRLTHSVVDIYKDALSQLGIRLEIEKSDSGSIKGSIKAIGEIGYAIFAKLGLTVTTTIEQDSSTRTQIVGHDVTDLKFIADLIIASDRRFVIEDFHYLTMENRKAFSHDLKAMWDYGLFIIIIGVWTQSNMMIYLNGDLSGRVEEIPLKWTKDELGEIIDKGCSALGLLPSSDIRSLCISLSYGNSGILQTVFLRMLDNVEIYESATEPQYLTDIEALKYAAMQYAEQLDPLYQQFAKNVSSGIRARTESTGIYAHSMAVIIESDDDDLINGLSLDAIFTKAHERQPRIQKGNLRSVLSKFDSLQVDSDGRGLVITYNPATEDITIVDKQLLLYRKFMSIKWPWTELLEELQEVQPSPDDFES